MDSRHFEVVVSILAQCHTAKLFFTDRGYHVLYGMNSQIILDPSDPLGQQVHNIIVNEWRLFDERVKMKYKNPAHWDPVPADG